MHDLERIADAIGEHYDSVIIIVTGSDGNGSEVETCERGNHLANYGAVKLWVKRQEAKERAEST